jgi:hypothetical protein
LVSIRVDKGLYWLTNQDKLFTFWDIEDVEVQEDFVTSHFQGHSMKNSYTFHYLAVDPLQELT